MDDNLIFGSPSNPAQQQNNNVGQVPVPNQQKTEQVNELPVEHPVEPSSPVQVPLEAPQQPFLQAEPSSVPPVQNFEQNQQLQEPVSAPPPPPPPPSIEVPPSDGNQNGSVEEKKSLFSLGAILKIFIGIVVVVVLLFLIFKFVLPMFSKQKTGNVTLTYWGLWEDSSVVQSAISEFEKENPTIKVSYSKEDSKQYRERLTTRMNNGTGPDVFRFHNSWYPMLSKYLVPVPTDVVSASDFKKNYYPVAQQDLIKNGAIYGIPLEIDTLAIYINTDYFKTAGISSYPKTWEEFINAARKLTVKDETGKIKTAGAAIGTFENISHAPDIISMLFLQNGVKLSDINSTSQEAADALKFYTDFATGDGSVWDSTLDNSILAFAKGNLAMCFGYSWDAFTIKALNPNLNYQVIPVPQLATGKIAIASYWAEGVSAKSKNQKEALLFLKFLAKKETSQKLFTEAAKTRMYGEPYARVDLASSLKDNALIYPFVQQAPIADSSFMVDGTFDNGLNTKSNEYLKDAVNSMVKDNGSATTAIETLVKGVSQVLQQYGQ